MAERPRKLRNSLILYGLVATAGLAVIFSPVVSGQEAGAGAAANDPNATCMSCHSTEMEGRPAVHIQKLKLSPHKDLRCQDCHISITGSGPHPAAQLKQKATCATCHSDKMELYKTSVHARPDKVPGDHPTCVTCHAEGDPHGVFRFIPVAPSKIGASVSTMPKRDMHTAMGLVQNCSKCHQDKARMQRYGVDPDAVPSYNESFHGKALMRFGLSQAAVCTDCHHAHDVLSPRDIHAPTFRTNAARTCNQCHTGARMNFAMSGANHVRLKVKESPVLTAELWFFRILIFCVSSFLALMVLLDLRKKVFAPGPPPASGRPAAVIIALSFIFMSATIVLAALQNSAALYTWPTAIVLLGVALIVYKVTHRGQPRRHEGPRYPRWPTAFRWQHGIMALCMILLMATGLPQRFAFLATNKHVFAIFGGYQGARMTHRAAAVVLIIVWFWHLIYLLIRWAKQGFSFKDWNMLPNLKDATDLIQTILYYLGLRKEEPRFGRFAFKNKLDYLAEYWGMPVMVLSGLILWFPIYWSGRLPEGGLSFAYIAHSWEATLAFLSIITWHMYNAHFNPEDFPMKDTWITGTATREEMEREHPLELEQMERDGSTGRDGNNEPPRS